MCRWFFMNNSQEIAIRIKELARTKNMQIGKLLEDCELSKNALSSMKSGGFMPRLENLIKIADKLNCSVDYLLGRTSLGQSTDFYRILLSDDGMEMIRKYLSKCVDEKQVDIDDISVALNIPLDDLRLFLNNKIEIEYAFRAASRLSDILVYVGTNVFDIFKTNSQNGYDKLNDVGQEKVNSYIEDLLNNPKYTDDTPEEKTSTAS